MKTSHLAICARVAALSVCVLVWLGSTWRVSADEVTPKQPRLPARVGEVPVSVFVSGPVVDRRLTFIYGILAEKRPGLLKPVDFNQLTFDTESEAILERGVLLKDYPKTFSSNVIEPLSHFAGYRAIPGLKAHVWSYRESLTKEDAKRASNLCTTYRIDGGPCDPKFDDERSQASETCCQKK